MRTMRRMGAGMAVLLAVSAGSGCWAAAAAGGGAAAGVYLTDQKAESTVNAPLADVALRTRTVLAEMRISIQDREVEPDDREVEIHGVAPEGDAVHVELDGGGATTRVRVSVRDGVAKWDQEYARSIMQRIVQGF
ncbi:DUF3568 family protein [Longimicrobium sp.]|uniref:DUF3568 family protein n=1 Tax=Longimicrobium sp. TaxID=2029185 RepID=UPI002E2F6086|nr:DUF3568 family protein [Longimicrobium sp.]HEX6041283.1 DUF3568 family protein [Longimicrobium sp.]